MRLVNERTSKWRRRITVILAAGSLMAGVIATAPAGAHPTKGDGHDDPVRSWDRMVEHEALDQLRRGGALAADPPEGRVSLEDRMVTWSGQHYPVGTAPFPGVTCSVPSERVCDRFLLSVEVDPGHWDENTGGVEITITWPDPSNDFDLHVFDRETGENVGSSIGVNPSTGEAREQVFVEDAAGGYEVLVNPFSVEDSAYEGQVLLESQEGVDPRAVPTERLSDVPCEDGRAGPFDCDGVDLLGFVPADEFDSAGISDIWGWTDPENGDEYAIMGKTNGTAFFRVSDPTDPDYLGELPNPAVTHEEWHDIKVYEDHAFIVSESEPHGMTVFDLTRLRDVEVAPDEPWDADAHYRLHSAAHNVVINEDSGYAYIVGGNAGLVGPDQCLSGLHIVDISDPTNPTPAGCYLEEGGPGTAARSVDVLVGGSVGEAAVDNSPAAYVHDAQCVIYAGPDERYHEREICLMASEDKVVIADVTDKLTPTTLGTLTYEDVGYAHQGWLTEDQAFWIVNDELDEENGLVDNTRTVVLDVSDLEEPKVHFEHFHETVSPDHNNYVHEGLLYQSNYSSGLRVLDTAFIDAPDEPRLEEIAFFDTFPAAEDTFDGTWSNYPFFDSGTIAVSGRGEGLFLLGLQGRPGEELGVEIVGPERPVTIRAGDSATADLTVRNVGDVDDTYQLAVTGLPDGWTATVAPTEVDVAAGQDAPTTVTVEVPSTADPGRSTVAVTATSTADPGVSASTDIPVVVRQAGNGADRSVGNGASSDGASDQAAGSRSIHAAGDDGEMVSMTPAALARGMRAPGSVSMLVAALALLAVSLKAGRRRRRRPPSGSGTS